MDRLQGAAIIGPLWWREAEPSGYDGAAADRGGAGGARQNHPVRSAAIESRQIRAIHRSRDPVEVGIAFKVSRRQPSLAAG